MKDVIIKTVNDHLCQLNLSIFVCFCINDGRLKMKKNTSLLNKTFASILLKQTQQNIFTEESFTQASIINSPSKGIQPQ